MRLGRPFTSAHPGFLSTPLCVLRLANVPIVPFISASAELFSILFAHCGSQLQVDPLLHSW